MIGSPFVEGLDGPDVRAVLAAATTRRFPSHAIIYEQGRPAAEFFLLAKGRARYFCINPDGRKMLLHWLVPGDVLGMARAASGCLAPTASAQRQSRKVRC